MAETQEGYQVPSPDMDDVPIVRHSRNPTILNLQHVNSSKKTGIQWLIAANRPDFPQRYKITIFKVMLLIAGLILVSTSIAYMAMQFEDISTRSGIERIFEEKPALAYKNFPTDDEELIYKAEGPIGGSVYRNPILALRNREKRGIREIKGRQVAEMPKLKNDETSSMRLHRVQTGSKFPRESETIQGKPYFFKEILNDPDEKLNNDKRETERRDKIRVCKRDVEHCKSILDSMQSLVKTTGDNVESLNKLMEQIRINEKPRDVDSNKFQAFLQCIECDKITNNDSLTFDNDSEQDDAPTGHNHPVLHNRQSQRTNSLAIAEILNKQSTDHDQVTERVSRFEEIKYSSTVVETSTTSAPALTSMTLAQHQENTDQGLPIKNPNEQSTSVKSPETSTPPSLDFTSPRQLQDRPPVRANTPHDIPTGPSAIYNNPGLEDTPVWAEKEKTEAAAGKLLGYSPMAPEEMKSDRRWSPEYVSKMAEFDPRIMTGTQYQPANGVYGGNSMMHPTAETSKTSQQVQYTPPVSWMPYPVCFFGSPTLGTPSALPFKQSMPGMSFPASASGSGSYPFAANQFPQKGFGFSEPSMGQGYRPMPNHRPPGVQSGFGQQFQYGNPPSGFQQGSHMGPTAPGTQGYPPNFGNFPTGPGHPGRSPFYCTYLPTPTYQFPSLPGVSDFRRENEDPREHILGETNSYGRTWSGLGTGFPDYRQECSRNYQRCGDGSYCIPKKSWCNGKVECPDASDETNCSCRDRVNKDRICDGYFDCPRGEDELGCFECPSNSFSCEDWTKHGRGGSCVTWSQRCDGLNQCSNGKDERDCSILTRTYVENRDLFTVGYTTGYLHKNWQGRWYPVCTPTETWAMDACSAETGFPIRELPRIHIESMPPGEYPQAYLAQSINGEIKVVPSCNGKSIYVKCPEIPCGTRVLSNQERDSEYDRYEDSLLGNPKNRTSLKNETSNPMEKTLDEIKKLVDGNGGVFDDPKSSNDTDQDILGESRVVGGRVSQPKAWPFLVAIRKDGHFHCGGVILNEYWVLTAAHCVDGFSAHFYEVQAGLLRRFSFSPMAQTRRANYIKIHHAYQRDILKNDLALIRLDEPLLFNRWIRPTCLPENWRTDSRNQPLPDTSCVTAGWGTILERGPVPDHMHEVEVPINRECKEPEDQNDASICAGVPQGGRDACQGDSGGPLMCSFGGLKDQWYVAGIVSHGVGCGRPNEPGAYTKVSRFVDWIDIIIQTQDSFMIGPKPRKVCPGFSCAGGLGKCLPASKRCDDVVNCLDAEDEINCRHRSAPGQPIVAHGDRDHSNKETVGQLPPAMNNEDVVEHKTTNSPVDEANPEVSKNVLDETSTAKSRVETSQTSSTIVRNNTETISSDVTGFQRATTTTMKPQSYSRQYEELRRFTCTRLIQSLPISKRCNRVIDCEDGTDEDDCSCKDYLANSYPSAICNGYVDCYDGSDEKNCSLCREDEFVCRRSGTCISRTRLCDHNVDCDNMEDELDCFALTNGDYVTMDFDERPHLHLQGVATHWQNNKWRPICVKQNETNLERLSDEFCEYFGFGSAETFKDINVRDSSLDIRASTKDHVFPYEYSPYFTPTDTDGTCNGIYVHCKPVVSANMSQLIITNPSNNDIDYLWPWQASIFVNGLYHCPAILLEHSWLLTSSQCVRNLYLQGNYTIALLGMAPTYLHADSPYQQMASIDTIKVVEKLDAALLHLKSPVNLTRYVQPIFAQKRIFPASRHDVCVATGVDEKFHTGTAFLRPVVEPCPQCHRCYRNATFEDCKNNTRTNWSGTIVCRGSGTWYPAAIFHEKDIKCGFQSVVTLTGIDYGNAHITEIMEEDLTPIAGPICDGIRCPLGACIPWDRVCDGVDNCRDGSDEKADHCEKKQKQCETSGRIGCKCAKSELRCASGQCVAKEAFCDYKIDCEDGTDETANCTCADYLRLTAPDRLCNNVRDCLDKTDENNEYCPCKDASFKCSDANATMETCVSQDFVCDGEMDCPNGEDEKVCRTVRGTLEDPHGTGQVLRRSFGIWHSECFPSPPVSIKDISDICRSIGFDSGEALTFGNQENPYGPALVTERDEFHMIIMNQRTWVTMRNNRPLANLVKSREICHRAFVKCL